MAIETGNSTIDLVISLATGSLDPETQNILQKGDRYKVDNFPFGFVEGTVESEIEEKFPGYLEAAAIRRELLLSYLKLDPSLIQAIAAQSILMQMEEELSLN